MLTCPLCRGRVDVEESLEAGTGLLARKVQGAIENTALMEEIKAWVAANPEQREPLLGNPESFLEIPDDPQRDEDEEIAQEILPRRVPGLIEDLSLLQPSTRRFGPSFFIESRQENLCGNTRDFLLTFNEIWQQIPYEFRPEFIENETLTDFERIIRAWIGSSEGVEALHSIEILNLQNLGLSKLPGCVRQLRSLQYLDISGNQLEQFPNIPSLKWLNVRDNHIEKIDDRIETMTNLDTLLMTRNPVQRISAKIAFLPKLKILELTRVSPSFEGLPMQLIAFHGKIHSSTRHIKQLADAIHKQVVILLKASELLRKAECEKAEQHLRSLAAPLQDMVAIHKTKVEKFLVNKSITITNSSHHLKSEILYMTALYCIGWLYWHKEEKLAETLFSQLPEELRHQVYHEVYLLAPSYEEITKRKRNVEFGRMAFHRVSGYDVSIEVRLRAITEAGHKRIQSLGRCGG
ncbi:MAG: leucine-rich repeat domain-containing protein [Anaplasmataceae bacterium]|nr:leucine-rich repeat domain-containing protein [Anaplasmataceae bacterium]